MKRAEEISDSNPDMVSAELFVSSLRFRRWLIPFLCEKAGITQEELRGPSREGNLCAVRQAACYFLWRYSAFTLREIASFIGRSDHTVTKHHAKSFIDECDVMPERRKTNRLIEEAVRKAYKNGEILAVTTLPNRSKKAAL